MKKIIITAVLIAWAGTIYGAYAWGSNKGPSDSTIAAAERATLCSIGREGHRNAIKALDQNVTSQGHSVPLRVHGREAPDTPLGKEAKYQETRIRSYSDTMVEFCLAKN